MIAATRIAAMTIAMEAERIRKEGKGMGMGMCR